MVVPNAQSLDQLPDLPLEGYNRLSPSGGDRHVAVSTSGGFRMFDTGTWPEPRGDHAHHHTAELALSDVVDTCCSSAFPHNRRHRRLNLLTHRVPPGSVLPR